jgi:uncharacterized protein YkwD
VRVQKLAFGFAFTAAAVTIVACGGGGGGGGSSPGGGSGVVPTPTPTQTATQTATQTPTTVSGTVFQIPSDAYGPVTMGSATYASTDATQTTALVSATVIVGSVPVVGATAPATLPSGDVSTTTTSAGAFSVSVPVAPVAPSTAEPFVIPSNNILGITPPATGYYVEVFGTGTDGKSAGVPIPLHRFVAAGTSIALRVSSTTAAEAGALTAVNNDRASNNNAGALIFDESAEEVARLHATDEVDADYYCHYDTHNVGPSSRYLAIGGIGLTGEALGAPGSGMISASQAFSVMEAAVLAEKAQLPPGGHYTNLVDSAHLWAGLAAAAWPINDAKYPSGFYAVDYDLITPSAQDTIVGSSGYPVTTGCPVSITDNGS